MRISSENRRTNTAITGWWQCSCYDSMRGHKVPEIRYKGPCQFSKDIIRRKAACVLIDRIKNRNVKRHFLMGSEGCLTGVLNQTLKLEAPKAAAGPLAKLQGLGVGVLMSTARATGLEGPYAGSVGTLGISE
jgi:hypothetical protein